MKLIEMKPSAAQGKVLLKFENGQKLRVPYFLAADYSLTADCELDDEAFSELCRAAGAESAKERACRILSMTNTSEKALRRSLQEKGETAADVENAVSWLKELHLLDDRKAGESMVRSAVTRGYGRQRAELFLREKGIDEPLRSELLRDYPPMDETIDRLLRKKIKSDRPDRKELQRAADALRRNGFAWSEIRAGLERFESGLVLEEP